MKKLEDYGVQKLNVKEMKKITGGDPIGTAWYYTGVLVRDFISWLESDNQDYQPCDSGCGGVQP